MIRDQQNRQRPGTHGLRSMMDMVMGTLIVLIGVYFLVYEKMEINVFRKEPSPVLDVVVGLVFILYGGWRIYRGYKKIY
ncbi:MAG: hypothetical protein H0U44_11545 [Flavisolibacter sp.]|nr:hypothetical protein [Flavisolibacter sp.]